MKLIIENVRCFSGRHELPIRPITLLVGENSSGKTTALGALSVITNQTVLRGMPKFDTPPYDWGNYYSIATYRGGRFGRAKSFGLGIQDPSKNERGATGLYLCFRETGGQPSLSKMRITSRRGALDVQVEGEQVCAVLEWGEHRRKFSLRREIPEFDFRYLLHRLVVDLQPQESQKHSVAVPAVYQMLDELLTPRFIPTISLAPVRTKPERTYDRFKDDFTPEGDHVPYILYKYFESPANGRGAKDLIAALRHFGEISGLFRSVTVKKLGKRPGDPFQVLVSVAGRPFNLTDVGYGVSQSLPIVVDSMRAPKGSMILMQQPEVHLHPQAQAALATLLVQMSVAEKKQLVIETHSDHILDRVRLEIARGTVPCEGVCFLYFEKHGLETTVHELTFDSLGNLIGAPPSYRRFFLDEEVALLTKSQQR
ncbi:AAA family ATPase [bacterium]|nr:AAA family ATPase [bacterium]